MDDMELLADAVGKVIGAALETIRAPRERNLEDSSSGRMRTESMFSLMTASTSAVLIAMGLPPKVWNIYSIVLWSTRLASD